MATKEIPFFGGYTLRYGWAGLEALTSALDAPAFTDFEKIVNQLGPKHLRMILWAGLIHKFPEMTPSDVIPLIDEYLETKDISDLSKLVGEALTASGIIKEGADKGEVLVKVKSRRQ